DTFPCHRRASAHDARRTLGASPHATPPVVLVEERIAPLGQLRAGTQPNALWSCHETLDFDAGSLVTAPGERHGEPTFAPEDAGPGHDAAIGQAVAVFTVEYGEQQGRTQPAAPDDTRRGRFALARRFGLLHPDR